MAQTSIHIMTHFEQEICGICDQNLVRIGEQFYVLHGSVTCIPTNIKTETSPPPSPYELNDEYELEETSAPSIISTQFVRDLKGEAEAIGNENEDFDQNDFTLAQEDHMNAADVELDAKITISEPSIKDETFDQYNAPGNRSEKVQPIRDATKIEKRNIKQVKSTRQIRGKSAQFECDECHKTYTRIDHLKRHEREVHNPSEGNFVCNECGTKFSFQYRLNYHKKSNAICNICGKIFCMKKQLLLHQEEEHDMIEVDNKKSAKLTKCKIDGCNEMIASHGWIEHLATKHSAKKQRRKINRYECEICSKTYKTKNGIEFHILSIHCPSSKKFKCQICNYVTVSQKALEGHQKKIHFKPRNFMCSECGKTFHLRSQLKMHSYQHSLEKPFSCTFEGCSKKFRDRSQIYEHMRMHTGEKPYSCSVENCDRRFAYKIDLKRHKFSAHGIYTNKYPCEICSEIFPENMLLKKHMKKHEMQV